MPHYLSHGSPRLSSFLVYCAAMKQQPTESMPDALAKSQCKERLASLIGEYNRIR